MESQQQPSLLGRLFDNVWVLVGLLILLATGAFFLVRWNRPSPEQMFARGSALMQQPEGPGWEVARTQYFDPLLEQDSATWGPQIEPFLPQLQLYELKRQILGRDRKTSSMSPPGPESILRQALELRRTGQISLAREKLIALETLTEGTEKWQVLADMAARLREELEKHQSPEQSAFIEQALERAEQLRQNDRTSAAVAIWRSILELYDSDPDAAGSVKQARQRLEETSSASTAASPSPAKVKTP